MYGIESQVVGYNTKEAVTFENSENHTYNMVAVPFTGIGSGFNLNKDFAIANGTHAANILDADTVMIWDPTAGDGVGTYESWFCWNGEDIAEGDSYPEYDGCWVSEFDYWIFFDDDDQHPDGLEAGSTFWLWLYNKDGAHSTSTSGAVLDAASKDVEYYFDKYNMVTDPFPVALKLNDPEVVQFNTPVKAANVMDADNIMIWDPTAGGGIGTYENWFCWDGNDIAEGDEYPEYDGCWVSEFDYWVFFDDDDQHPDGLDVGTAFWYLARGTYDPENKGSITFFGPLAK